MRPAALVRPSVERVRHATVPIVEMTVAATLAWILDTRLVGHPQPFFAPAAAIIVLGQARGHRWQRATEVVLGVAGGVLVADVVAHALGFHHWWTILVIVVLPLVVAAALGASTVFTVQAAVSALYVAVVPSTSGSVVPFRFVDALVGGGVALVISQLAVVRDPLAPLGRDLHVVLSEQVDVLLGSARALENHDEQLALQTLARARTLDATVVRLRAAVAAAEEALLFHPRQRQRLGGVRALEPATAQLDYVVRSGRVLARAAVTLTRLPDPAPPEVIAALRRLADAVRSADEALGLVMVDEPVNVRAGVETAALDALRIAGHVVPPDVPLPLVMLIGQLRTMAIDMLRAVGADDDRELLRRIDDALSQPA
jgi:uncharacterized membrane protein YgaE (UPF0421/DUF939 family)